MYKWCWNFEKSTPISQLLVIESLFCFSLGVQAAQAVLRKPLKLIYTIGILTGKNYSSWVGVSEGLGNRASIHLAAFLWALLHSPFALSVHERDLLGESSRGLGHPCRNAFPAVHSAAEAEAMKGSGGGMSSQLEVLKAKNKAPLFWCVCGVDEGQGSFWKSQSSFSPTHSPGYILYLVSI